MKTRIFATLISFTFASWVAAAEPGPEASAPPAGEDSVAPVTPDKGQIEVLLAPVALYPDALVAVILPAATHPSEVVLASRFLQSGGKEEDIDAQPWDDSVKSLAHYPEVVQFMDDNLAWTQDVGDAFVSYPADVMTAVQTLRARASRNGMLADTSQQHVAFDDDGTIRIVPAEPDVIYVPYYEPSVLYYTDAYAYYPSSLVWFGVGYGIGSWLSYDCDWGHRSVWVTHHRNWDRNYDWRRRYDHHWGSRVGGNDWTCWRPSPGHRTSRPRGDFNFSRTTTRVDSTRFDGNRDNTRTRSDWRRDSSSATSSPDYRSVRRPETLRNPAAVDGGDRNRTAGGWHDRRTSDSPSRYSDPTPVEKVDTTVTETRTSAPRRQSLAPIHRSPGLVDRRERSTDRRTDVAASPRPAPQMRRDSPRPTVSAPRTGPAPARPITSGAQIRHPQPAPSSTPMRSAPAPAMRREPVTTMRSAPVTVTRSDPVRSSPSPSAGSIRHGRTTDEN